jgi:hypothetical protein
VRFQQAAHKRPFDDITIDAANGDGSPAYLDVQAKRTINFGERDPIFSDVVRRLWATAQKSEFKASRYEVAVAVARTSTRIERDCQQVLHWARQLTDGVSFAAHIQQEGFASAGMRSFVAAFRQHLLAASAPTDDETVWRLLRRFQILPFDFESIGSDYDHRARERARMVLTAEQAERAGSLWAVLAEEALTRDAAGGEIDRADLTRLLAEKYGFRFGALVDLRTAHKRLKEMTGDTLADIRDQIGDVRLSRAELIEECRLSLDQARVCTLWEQEASANRLSLSRSHFSSNSKEPSWL